MSLKRFLEYANEFIRQSDWKDIAALKFCLLSAGMILGIAIPRRVRKMVVFSAMGVFLVTYLPLILKFLQIGRTDRQERWTV